MEATHLYSVLSCLAELLILTVKVSTGCLFFRKSPVVVAYRGVAYKRIAVAYFDR